MSFFNSAGKTAGETAAYFQRAATDSLFIGLTSKRDLMAELQHARDAYQLVVGKDQGFYEELVAQAGELPPGSADEEPGQLARVGNVYSCTSFTTTFPFWATATDAGPADTDAWKR